MNLATMTQAPTTLLVGGKTFQVGPFRYLELGVIQRHLDETCPAPIPQVGDGSWVDALFSSVDGVAFFLNLLFSKHQAFTAGDLAFVLSEVGPRQLGALFAIAMDEPPPASTSSGSEPGPKLEAAPSTT